MLAGLHRVSVQHLYPLIQHVLLLPACQLEPMCCTAAVLLVGFQGGRVGCSASVWQFPPSISDAYEAVDSVWDPCGTEDEQWLNLIVKCIVRTRSNVCHGLPADSLDVNPSDQLPTPEDGSTYEMHCQDIGNPVPANDHAYMHKRFVLPPSPLKTWLLAWDTGAELASTLFEGKPTFWIGGCGRLSKLIEGDNSGLLERSLQGLEAFVTLPS